MADRKISDMSALAAGSQATDDVIAVVDVSESAAADKNKKMTMENLFKGIPGNVGIGTASPDTTLTVSGSGAGIRVQPTNVANASIFLRHGSVANNSGLEADSTGALGLYSNGSQRVRIDNSGRLLINNTTSTNGRLIVEDTGFQISLETGTAGDGRLNIGHFSNGTFIGTYGDDGGAADLIRFGTHTGDERMRIDSFGRVGIGTTVPETTFHVEKSLSHSSTFYANADAHILIDNPSTDATAKTVLKLEKDSAIVYGGGTSSLIISDRQNERMRIDSSGNFGIGTSSPLGKLKIAVGDNAPASSGNMNTGVVIESAFASRALNLGVDNTAGYSWINAAYANNSGVADNLVLMTGTAERMRIDSSGRVVIGATSTPVQFSVQNSTSNLGIEFDTASGGFASGSTVRAYDRPGTTYRNLSLTGADISFGIQDVEKARFDSSGRLLVGTTTTFGTSSRNSFYSLLQIRGNTSGSTSDGRLTLGTGATTGSNTSLGSLYFCDTDGGDRALIRGYSTSAGASENYPGYLTFWTNSGTANPTERMRIDSNGLTDISATNANGYGLKVHNEGNNSDRYGIAISCGTNAATGTNYAVAFWDGDGTAQGYITFTGGTVTYGAFTAHHPCILPEADNEAGYAYGTLLEVVSIEYTQKDGVNTERGILYQVQKSQSANSRKLLGAYGSSMNNSPEGETNRHQALVLGDGHILCNSSGGNIEVGDGICSSTTAGIGQKATASPSMIIGIAQENVTFANDTEQKLVAVQYGLQQFIPWS